MDWIRNIPLFTIVLSLFSGVLCTILKRRAARWYTIAYEMILLAGLALVLRYTLQTGKPFVYVMGEFPAPGGNEIRAGVLEAALALLFVSVMLCSVIAGGRYLKKDIDGSKQNLYYALVNLMTAALLSILWTNDIFTGYVFLEILTLTSCGILLVREIGRTTLAAVRYMVMNLLGSGLFLMGVVLLYAATGNLLMEPMHRMISLLAREGRQPVLLIMGTGLITAGLSIKSGLFPFHFWMPDTYGWATPASGAILSAIVSKCYIFLLLKIYYRVIGINLFQPLPIRILLLVLGMSGIVFGSVSALHAGNINRMVAFSSAAQIGYIYMGIGIGGTAGYTAAFFHIFAHSVTKSLLFLSTPRLAEVSGNSLLFKALQGSALRDRTAGVYFDIGALSMIGIPIFAGFSSKLLFGSAAVTSGNLALTISVMAVLALSSVLNALYFIRTIIRIYTRPEIPGVSASPERLPLRIDFHLPLLFLTAANLALGLFSGLFTDLIRTGLSMLG